VIQAVLALFTLAQAGGPEALSTQALEMAQQHRFVEAEALWRKALAASPALFSANFNLGFMHYSQGQAAKAEPYLARAVQARPGDFNARYIYGAVLSQLARGDDALRQWRAALEIKPAQVKLMQIMAVEYSKGRYFRDAAAVAERALKLEAKEPNLYLIAIKAYQDAANHPAALKVAAAFAERYPDSPRAAFEYGFELYRNGRPAEGLPYLRKAIASGIDYEEPYFFYGEVLAGERRFEDSLEPFRKAIEIKRDYIAAWIGLARSLMALGRYAEAGQELERAAGVDPRHPLPHLLLSQVLFRQGKEDLAASEKDLSLRLRRENPQAMEQPQGRPFR